MIYINDWVVNELGREIEKGITKFGHFNTHHEGYAVILEELDELWAEIKSKDRVSEALYQEAIQVAATALRFAQQVKAENWPGSFSGDGT